MARSLQFKVVWLLGYLLAVTLLLLAEDSAPAASLTLF
jgi:hypothetical protein